MKKKRFCNANSNAWLIRFLTTRKKATFIVKAIFLYKLTEILSSKIDISWTKEKKRKSYAWSQMKSIHCIYIIDIVTYLIDFLAFHDIFLNFEKNYFKIKWNIMNLTCLPHILGWLHISMKILIIQDQAQLSSFIGLAVMWLNRQALIMKNFW